MLLNYQKPGAVGRSDARPPGMRSIAGSKMCDLIPYPLVSKVCQKSLALKFTHTYIISSRISI